MTGHKEFIVKSNILIVRSIIITVVFIAFSIGTIVNAALIPVIIPQIAAPQCLNYVISLNLTYAIPIADHLTSPLQNGINLVTNTVQPWYGLSHDNLTLIISGNDWAITSTTETNSTGGALWRLCINPTMLPKISSWSIVIGQGNEYPLTALFAFKTRNISLASLLSDLTMTGGSLPEENNGTYKLWHHVGKYYGVPMPMHVVLYSFIGNALSPATGIDPLPQYFNGFKFPIYGNNISMYIISVINGSELINYYPANLTIGQLTGFGLSIYGVTRLLPFGPIQYNSEVLLLKNYTLIDASCLTNYYYITGIRLMLLNPAYGIYVPLTVYYFKTEPTGLLSINGSIIVGGYLSEYDFHNDTVVTISPINYGQPINACIVPINNT